MCEKCRAPGNENKSIGVKQVTDSLVWAYSLKGRLEFSSIHGFKYYENSNLLSLFASFEILADFPLLSIIFEAALCK